MDSLSEAASSVPLVVDRFLPRRFKKYPTLFALIVAVAFALASAGIAFFAREPSAYLGLCLPIAFGLFSVPFAFRFAHQRFVAWAHAANGFVTKHGTDERLAHQDKNVQLWLLKQLSFFGESTGMYVTGLLLPVWTILAFSLGGYFSYQEAWQIAFAWSLMGFSAFVAGLGLYAILGAARFIWRLGDGGHRIVVRNHKFGVLSTGQLLLECYFVIALVCTVYYLSAVTGEESPLADLKYWNPPVWMLVVPTALFILGSFVICQLPLHSQMVMYKREKLLEAERRLDELTKKFEQTYTAKAREEIRYQEERRLKILSLPEWPFGFKGMLGAIGSSATVMLPTLLSLLIKTAERPKLPFFE